MGGYIQPRFLIICCYFSVYRNLSTGMVDGSDKARTTGNQENVE